MPHVVRAHIAIADTADINLRTAECAEVDVGDGNLRTVECQP